MRAVAHQWSVRWLASMALLSLVVGALTARFLEGAPPAPTPCPPIPSHPVTTRSPPSVAPPLSDGTRIASCPESGLLEVETPSGTTLYIAPRTISRVVSATYGRQGKQTIHVEGLLDAFVRDGGLHMEVNGEVLGGTADAKGSSILKATFACGWAPVKTVPLPDAAEEWLAKAIEQENAAATEGAGSCEYRSRQVATLPGSCTAGNDRSACLRDFYTAISDYANKEGTDPVLLPEALRCQLTELRGANNGSLAFKLSALAQFAQSSHTVWLIRITPDKRIAWDAARKASTWQSELASFSILHMTLELIEEVLHDLPVPQTIYFLYNALDEPKIGPPPQHSPKESPHCSTGVLRGLHQAFCVPSAAWMEANTQWGAKSLLPRPQGMVPPLLSWSIVPGWHGDLVAPNRHPGSCHHFFFDPAIAMTPFEEKEDKVLFRAFSAACDPNSNGPRQRLVCFAERHNGKIEINGTTVELDIGGGRGWGPTGSQRYMSPARQARAKYILLLDGVVAAFRSTWLLQSGSVILATGVWQDVRTQLLKPWIHYIPFSSDLHDFEAALSVVVGNQTYAKWVSDNARRASLLLSGPPTEYGREFDKRFYASYLKMYTQHVTVQEDITSIRWSSEKNCDSWNATQGRIRQCIPDSYACPSMQRTDAERYKIGPMYFQGNG